MSQKGGKDGNYYISSMNTKRNPDLIIPGGSLKGNMYFKKRVDDNHVESSNAEEEQRN